MFAGFEERRIRANGLEIALVRGGTGPALLLLHGHPQTHVIWHKIAEQLAIRFTVVAADLRGYGDSDKPEGLPDHSNYSKRVMAQDQVDVMCALGHEDFFLVGHDRGGRVAYRLALDHPQRVKKLVTLDIAPTLAMYEGTTMEFAKAYFHWFLLIQPAPFPETLINADPEFFLKSFMGKGSAGLSHFAPEAFAEYLRCFKAPGTAHGICGTIAPVPASIWITSARTARRAARSSATCSRCGARTAQSKNASGRWRSGDASHAMCGVTHFHAATTFPKRLPSNCSTNCWSSCRTEQAYRT
jgi:haloacetate dehalogenase